MPYTVTRRHLEALRAAGGNTMSSFTLDGVRLEIGRRWEVRIATRSFEVDDEGTILRAAPSAGTWQRSGPNEASISGIALYVHDAAELRELAVLLLEATAELEALRDQQATGGDA